MKILVETNQLLTANDNTPVTRPACTTARKYLPLKFKQ